MLLKKIKELISREDRKNNFLCWEFLDEQLQCDELECVIDYYTNIKLE